MLYAHFGPYMPELIIHKGYSIERIATALWLTTEGIFGPPIAVAESLAANGIRWTVAPKRKENPTNRPAVSFARDELKGIINALETGAKNAIMVSVACAAAGIIVGMVTLTGMGLKFSSLGHK